MKFIRYYIKLEDIFHGTIAEEAEFFKKELEATKNELEDIANSELRVALSREEALISQYPVNTECVYIGTFDYEDEQYMKFGQTNGLKKRINADHKKFLSQFYINSCHLKLITK